MHEVVTLNFVAVLLTWVVFDLVLPYFSRFAGLPSEHNILGLEWLWITLFILFSSGVFAAGIYPAISMSSFRPIEFLRLQSGITGKQVILRRILVIFQFLISLSLITWTLAVFNQVSFMQKQNLGIKIKDIVSVRVPRVIDETYQSKVETFKAEVTKLPDVEEICIVSELPGRQIFWDAGGIFKLGSDESKNYQIVGIDYEFADVFDVSFASGRNFSRAFPSDSSALILNETAVRWMDFPDVQSAIGEKVDYWRDIYTIVGVMKDYHQQSPKKAFEPHIYRLMPYGNIPRGFFALTIQTNDLSKTMKQVEEKFHSFFPDNAFEYFSIEEYYNQQFDSDHLLGNIFAIFSFLAILITIMGITGLTSYMVLQRTKEFSIRIIMGAGVLRIFRLFTQDFVVQILIATLISIPVCLLTIRQWLNAFESKMRLSPWLFIVPFVIVAVITGSTIALFVMRVSRTNAAENLRYE
jgi:putative ABC transport system permease protein